jgi:glycosyltransferase involved in cell wall biosynthesis
MRVLFVGEDIRHSKGGIVTVMKQLLHHQSLNKEVHYKTVFTTGDGFSRTRRMFGWLKAYVRFIYYLPSIDMIHIHHASNLNFWLTAGMVYLAKLCGRKVILHNHGADFKVFYERSTPLKRKCIIRSLSKANANIVLSESWLAWYRSIAPNANWLLLPNSVDIPADVQVKTLNNSGVVLVYLARIEERKGFFDMMDMLPGLFEKYPDCKLCIAGQGDIEMVKNLVRQKNLDDKIKILGYVNHSERDSLLRYGHILLLPSYDEGMPMSLLEAMSYGLVPVTTAVGGIPDVIHHGVNGILLKPGDKMALLSSLESLIGDPCRFGQMSRNAYYTITEYFNTDSYIDKLTGIYKSFSDKWN